VVLFDDNGISIDARRRLRLGRSGKAVRGGRLGATRVDGHDPEAIALALEKARTSSKPSLIACKTTMDLGTHQGRQREKPRLAAWGRRVKGARERLGWTAPASRCRTTCWRHAQRRPARRRPSSGLEAAAGALPPRSARSSSSV